MINNYRKINAYAWLHNLVEIADGYEKSKSNWYDTKIFVQKYFSLDLRDSEPEMLEDICKKQFGEEEEEMPF